MVALTLAISPLAAAPDVVIEVPGSKSHTNRALICAALAKGRSRLEGVLFAEDTLAMLDSLKTLGVDIQVDQENKTVEIVGVNGRVPAAAVGSPSRQPGGAGHSVGSRLDVRQSGTTGRFLLPMLTLGSGRYELDGDPQLRARPFSELVQSLQALGARIEGESLPLVVEASGLGGGHIEVSGSVSSQYLSGILLSAPCAQDEVVIEVTSELVSKPYIDLTLATMASFGVEVVNDNYRRFAVSNTGYRAAELVIEPDASAASYFFAAAAITGGRVTVKGLGRDTIQGDLGFVRILENMGASVFQTEDSTTVHGPGPTPITASVDRPSGGSGGLGGVEVDMADISDTAQTLAVVAPFASGPTRITGIGFIRKKETDRIGAVVQELSRLGIRVLAEEDGLVVHPGQPQPGIVDSHDDHRMAMSFAVLGLRAPGIIIDNPGCVKKTFPTFFNVLDQLRPVQHSPTQPNTGQPNTDQPSMESEQ